MEPWYETPLYFVITSLIFWVGSALDMYSSQHNNWMYGLHETNPLQRDRDHQFVLTRALIVHVAYYAVSCLIGVLSHSWGAATAICLVPAAASWWMYFRNTGKAKANRIKQIDFLTSIRNAYASGGDMTNFVMETLNGKSFHPLFQWLWVPHTDYTSDTAAVATKLWNHGGTVPESQWFVRPAGL